MMMPLLPPSSAGRAGRPVRSLLQQNGRLLLPPSYYSHSLVKPPLTTRLAFLKQKQSSFVQTTALSPAVIQVAGHGRACLSTAATSAVSSSLSSSSKSESGGNNSSSSNNNSNLILDHLGTIFLTTIGLVIASLVRSYYGTARKNALRDKLEAEAALDPLEIQELQHANPRLTAAVFRSVMDNLWNRNLQHQQDDDATDATAASITAVPTMTYSEFCLAVREILQTQHHSDDNPIPTIELGHYLDRVVLKLLQQQHHQTSNEPQSLTLWLVVLSLALSAPTPDRIQVLYEILQREKAMATARTSENLDLESSITSNNNNPIVTVAQVHELVGYLQSTCQLVIDNQLLATPDKKYPIQDYHQGSPKELVQWPHQGDGGDDGKDKNENEKIDVDALAAILRSRSVCAWGECYHKKKML